MRGTVGILCVLSANQSFWITCIVVDFSVGVRHMGAAIAYKDKIANGN